jgi:hypothetical protein
VATTAAVPGSKKVLSMNQLTHAGPGQLAHPGADQQALPSADLVGMKYDADRMRVKYGAWLVGASFALLGIVFGIAVSHFSAAADVTAAVGSVATVVGTIVGAFFGVHIGSAGKESAEAGRAHAEKVARVALGKLDPQAADDIIKAL